MKTKKQKLIKSLSAKRQQLAQSDLRIKRLAMMYNLYSNVLSNCSAMRPKAKTHGRIEGQPGRLWAAEADSVSWLKNVRDCGDVVSLKHTGWYTDDDCYETCVGIVGQLRTKGGLKYVTGYRYSAQDSVQWDLLDSYDIAVDAAISADSWASQVAERDREENEKFQAEQAREQAQEDLERVKKELFNLMIDAETKTLNRQAKGVQEAVKREIERLKSYAEQLKEECEA